jgi:hypothetical protein
MDLCDRVYVPATGAVLARWVPEDVHMVEESPTSSPTRVDPAYLLDGIELMASIARTSRFMISRMEETLSDYSLGLSQYLVLMTVLLSECLVDWLRRVGSPRPDLIIPPRCRRRRH